jgi:hypothetical protein
MVDFHPLSAMTAGAGVAVVVLRLLGRARPLRWVRRHLIDARLAVIAAKELREELLGRKDHRR